MARVSAILVVLVPVLAFASEEAGSHGPDFVQLAEHGFAFLVVAGILLYFGGKRVRAFHEARYEAVRVDVEAAEKALREAQERLAAAEQRLANLAQEIEQLMAEFRRLGESERDALAHKGAVLAQKLQEEMDFTLSQAAKMAKAELAQALVERAFAIVEQRLAASAQRSVSDQLIQRMEQTLRQTTQH